VSKYTNAYPELKTCDMVNIIQKYSGRCMIENTMYAVSSRIDFKIINIFHSFERIASISCRSSNEKFKANNIGIKFIYYCPPIQASRLTTARALWKYYTTIIRRMVRVSIQHSPRTPVK